MFFALISLLNSVKLIHKILRIKALQNTIDNFHFVFFCPGLEFLYNHIKFNK